MTKHLDELVKRQLKKQAKIKEKKRKLSNISQDDHEEGTIVQSANLKNDEEEVYEHAVNNDNKSKFFSVVFYVYTYFFV